jgi:hypothetical protein
MPVSDKNQRISPAPASPERSGFLLSAHGFGLQIGDGMSARARTQEPNVPLGFAKKGRHQRSANDGLKCTIRP